MLRFEPEVNIKDALARMVKPGNVIDDNTILEGYSLSGNMVTRRAGI
jgi:hypothetical protein